MQGDTPQVIKRPLVKKYLIIVFTTVINILLLIGSFMLGKNSNKTVPNIGNNNLQNEQTSEPNKKPLIKLSNPVMSPNNDLYLRFRSEEKGDLYTLDLLLDDFPNLHSAILSLDGKEIKDAVLTQVTGNKDQFQRMFYYNSNYISWSPKTNKFAVLLPEKVVIYNYSISPILNDTFSPKRNRVLLQKHKEFAINSQFDNFDYPVLLFSGNGHELFYSSSSGIKKLLPLEKDFKPQSGYYSSYIYPIPNQSGIAYWVDSGISGGKNHSIILDYDTTHRKYNLISNFSIDYPKEIELSPDLRKACVGWETSGGGGKILFDLETGEQIQLGTGCKRWLNNNEIVVYQSDSFSGSASGIVSYYLVNLTNGTKTLLHNYSSNF